MKIGLEILAHDPRAIRGERLGLLMNRASVDRNLHLACDVISAACPGQLQSLFTPQHGLWGDVQANMVETPHGWHEGLQIPVYSLYSETRRPEPSMLADIDCLLVDLQDVGTRVYTYVWTLMECMQACAESNVRLIVLDRPNPIGGIEIEGAPLQLDFASFVGGLEIPMRHGLTMGEMARLAEQRLSMNGQLEVVPLEGWDRTSHFPEWGRSWIPPSPNLPRYESSLTYPGQVLLEGTNLSEGRGTTTPFEVAGAPFIEPLQWLKVLQSLELAGVQFLPIQFRPTFDKWAGECCGGVSIHVTDRGTFRPYRTATLMLATAAVLWPQHFRWLEPPYEYEWNLKPIDIISGSAELREQIDRLQVAAISGSTDVLEQLVHAKGSPAWRRLWEVT